jgi:hypothetical protein
MQEGGLYKGEDDTQFFPLLLAIFFTTSLVEGLLSFSFTFVFFLSHALHEATSPPPFSFPFFLILPSTSFHEGSCFHSIMDAW